MDPLNQGQLPPFQPGSFTDISERPESKKLWAFLNDKENKLRMKVASDLGRPALEAVSSSLLAEFPEVFAVEYVHLNRFKQMAGAMTKQVMEADGYMFLRDNVPLSGAPFSRATKYRDRNAVDFHVWRLSVNPRMVGVTLAKTPNKLPEQGCGEWSFWKTVEGTMSEKALHLIVAVGIRDTSAALAALKTEGAYATLTERLMRAA